LLKIISGGQTGVDRAALDVALALNTPCGGWCPKGRKAEDGTIPDRYPLEETESGSYPVRTEMNVREADGTLILTFGKLTGGTSLTAGLARKHKKPYIIIDLQKGEPAAWVREWIKKRQVRVMNVAGPREGKNPGIHKLAFDFISEILAG